MSCRCVKEQWQRDRERQWELAKKAAVLTGQAQVLFMTADGRWCFVPDGEEVNGDRQEIITQY